MQPAHPHTVFRWNLKDVVSYIPKPLWFVLGLTSIIAMSFVFSSMFMNHQKGSPGIEYNHYAYLTVTRRHENEVLACSKNPALSIEPLQYQIREQRGLIGCAQKILNEGNYEEGMLHSYSNMEVRLGDGTLFYCPSGYDPTEIDKPKMLAGTKNFVKETSVDSEFLAKVSGALGDNLYNQGEISQTIFIKQGILATLEKKLENARNGIKDRTCSSKSHNNTVDLFLCAHVILGQIPQDIDCYNRNDRRHVNPDLKEMIEDFERGDITLEEEKATLDRFEMCAELLDSRVGAGLTPKQLLVERQKRMENNKNGLQLFEKCRKMTQ